MTERNRPPVSPVRFDPPPSVEGRQQKVLLVDDSPIVRDLLKVFLTGYDFQFLEAADGQAALGLIQSETPDLSIIDVNMPGLDGVEIVRRIRGDANESVRKMKVVVLTGEKSSEMRVAALKAGADRLLRKPVSDAGVVDVVTKLLGRKKKSSRPAPPRGSGSSKK